MAWICTAKCRFPLPRQRWAAKSKSPLDGMAKVKIAAETQSGRVYRLRGKGVKAVRGTDYGDLHCHVVVETPVKLTERQKELLREFEAISQGDVAMHNPRSKSFMDKLRDFFE
jgi:molecular chaperone DnaJ